MDVFWRGYCTFVLTTLVFQEVTGFLIRNEELRKCVQVNEGQVSSRLTLQECRADSALQEWHWNPDTRSLSNPQTGGCLTAPQIQEHESVWLQTCSSEEEDREGQAWSCSKKGLLTLHGRGLHLSVRHDTSKVFLSKDRGKGSKWRTLANQTVCEETDSTLHGQNVLQDSQQTLSTGPRILTQIRYWHSGNNDQTSRIKSTEATQSSDASAEPQNSIEPDGPSVNVFTTDYGQQRRGNLNTVPYLWNRLENDNVASKHLGFVTWACDPHS
ncbi:uncharacterized protein si:dkey-245n4.2 isoform X2 [Carassius gibelio]|uniref:uncharacterized protein si:dkey-245n4.2 isoform X2 n=1 Tax=Carassius gibelio TaxID=101364 RepID=UPI002278FCCA|nr:uncharacterized protein si:dkey-245n4.2 isoform X2 [Carassius gibelio]